MLETVGFVPTGGEDVEGDLAAYGVAVGELGDVSHRRARGRGSKRT